MHWSDAAYCFKHHTGVGTGQKIGLHGSTFALYISFPACMSGKVQPIEVMVDSNLKKTVAENRKNLIPTVDAIRLYGLFGLLLHGHCDECKFHPDVGNSSQGGVGNFVEPLHFGVWAGDSVLEEHLQKCPKNATYVSKNTQNELVKCCGQVISVQVVEGVKINFSPLLLMKLQTAQIKNKNQEQWSWGSCRDCSPPAPHFFPNVMLKQPCFKTLVMKFPREAYKMLYFYLKPAHS